MCTDVKNDLSTFLFCYRTVIPVIKEIPRVVTISRTKNVVIECRIQSIFEPQCTWKKDNTVIKDNVSRQTIIERVKDVIANKMTI